jgi:VIT1/CCC1 family predicted Fe2+/Mn2+ transporter
LARTAIGAGVSVSFSEGLSDTGGGGTFIGGFLHMLPFLISSYTTAIIIAILVVMFGLGTLAFLRMRLARRGFPTQPSGPRRRVLGPACMYARADR